MLPKLGLVEWFRPPEKGEQQRAENIIEFINTLEGLKYLRMDISWARCYEYGKPVLEFYDWFFKQLSYTSIVPLPNIMYTPPQLGMGGCYTSPPKDHNDLAVFTGEVLDRWGDYFEHIELWNEPNALAFYRHDLDPGWRRFRKMIKTAASVVAKHNKKVVFGGMSHPSPEWLSHMYWDYCMKEIDVVGFHSFPGTLQSNIGNSPWTSWEDAIYHLRKIMDLQQHKAKLWITETGASNSLGKYEQLTRFTEALKAPVDRLFWYSVQDFEGFMMEEEAGVECSNHLLNMGICSRGSKGEVVPKFLAECWQKEGLEGMFSASGKVKGRKAVEVDL
jgi:CDP-paratose 2-epimerase